jgi:hypothetical protein
MDGHKHPDVIKEREDFLGKIFNDFELYVGCIHFFEPQISDSCPLIKFDGIL